MWAIKDENFIQCDRYCKINETPKKEPIFTFHSYNSDWKVDFEIILDSSKKISWKLVKVYEKEKTTDSWSKYKLYWFVFEDEIWYFNIVLWDKHMEVFVNKFMETDLSKEVIMSVFDSPSKDWSKFYRNFAFRQEWQVVNNHISNDDKRNLVVETTNAVWEVSKDFSAMKKYFRDLFIELDYKLENLKKWLTIEDIETEVEVWDRTVEQVLEIQKKQPEERKYQIDAEREKAKMVADEDLPF